MKQLRNFRNSGNNNNNSGVNNNNRLGGEMEPVLKDAMNKYGNMDEDMLINQLVNQVRVSKQNGTYNPMQMQQYITVLKPHLNHAQFEKLKNLIAIINNEDVQG